MTLKSVETCVYIIACVEWIIPYLKLTRCSLHVLIYLITLHMCKLKQNMLALCERSRFSFFMLLLLRGAGARDGTVATLTARTVADAVLGHVTLTYEADVTGDVIELYGRQLDAICSAMLNQHLITPPLLDNLLTEAIFDDSGSSAHPVPLRAFELLFESTKYATSGTFVEYVCHARMRRGYARVVMRSVASLSVCVCLSVCLSLML